MDAERSAIAANRTFWLGISLIFALIYSFLGLREGFSSEYVVQDDARLHVVWMLRFVDPELFPNDLIADYFQSVAPGGYTLLYRLAAAVGISPLLFNKLLPPFLGLITSGYCFALCLQIFPVPAAAFLSTLLLNQNLWMKDDLASATPRAFAYPLMLAFLYYSRQSWLSWVAIALFGFFYPQGVFLCAGLCLLQMKQSPRFGAVGLGVAVAVLLPYALMSSEFGPIITAAQARQLPEFLPEGRSAFFEEGWATFWLFGGRSGLFPEVLLTPVTLVAGLFLPVLIYSKRFPLDQKLQPAIWLLPQLMLVSVGMFLVAHAFLFKLHLPNRYTGYSFRIILALAAGVVITLIIDALLRFSQNVNHPRRSLALFIAGAIAVVTIFYPSSLENFPKTNYRTGNFPGLYAFFRAQPKDIVIASLVEEADNLPAFAHRSVLVSREAAVPYHLGYYLPFRERVTDLIQAQYSAYPATVNRVINRYQIDFWLLDRSVSPQDLSDAWLKQYLSATDIDNLQNREPVLASLIERCSTFQEGDLVVLAAECIIRR